MKSYTKHLIECNCILPIFRTMERPPFHQFTVFSEVEEDLSFVKHHAACPNCGAIHNVTEVGTSTILKKETSSLIRTIEEISLSLPDKLVAILKENKCELYTWQEVEFLETNKLYDTQVVLSKEREEDLSLVVKVLLLLGPGLYKVQTTQIKDET